MSKLSHTTFTKSAESFASIVIHKWCDSRLLYLKNLVKRGRHWPINGAIEHNKLHYSITNNSSMIQMSESTLTSFGVHSAEQTSALSCTMRAISLHLSTTPAISKITPNPVTRENARCRVWLELDFYIHCFSGWMTSRDTFIHHVTLWSSTCTSL